MTLVRLKFAPGVVKTETEYSQPARAIDMDKIRWTRGVPETQGGYNQLGSTTFLGCPRGAIQWRDTTSQRYLIFGTNIKIYRSTSDGTLTDITPEDASGTLGSNPFSITSGSMTVSVAHTTHGRSINDYVTFSGASSVDNLDMNAEWVVTAVPDANTYEFEHTTAADSTTTGGGASVAYSYDLPVGLCDGTEGYGYGAGAYGTGFYGVTRPTSVTLHPRSWSLDIWGEDIIGCPKGGDLWLYDTSAGGVMAELDSGAPDGNTYVFVTKELHVVVLGAGGDPYRIENCDQNDYTTWTATATNQADGYSLPGGDPLVSGRAFRDGINCIWTKSSFWVRQFINRAPYWVTNKRASDAGIYGPHAHAEHDSIVYWMADGDFYSFDGLNAQALPSDDIRDFVFDDISSLQREKAWAVPMHEKGEVWFFYCSASSNEIDRYVIYYPKTGLWACGTYARTAGVDRDVFDRPIWLGSDNKIYTHEDGEDADGSALEKYIEYAPMEIVDGGDTLLDLFEVVPDFKNQVGDVDFYFYAKDKPNDTATTFGPESASPSTDKIDVRIDARQLGMKWVSNEVGGKARQGSIRVDISDSGNRG